MSTLKTPNNKVVDSVKGNKEAKGVGYASD